MSVLTQNRCSVTPFSLRTELSLSTIAQLANEQKYSGVVPSSGWGSMHDSNDLVGVILERPSSVGSVERLAAEANYPELMVARLYWDQPNRFVASSTSGSAQYLLDACDLIVSQSATDSSLKTVYASVSASSRLANRRVGPALQALLHDEDSKVQCAYDAGSLGLDQDDDFFRWLLWKSSSGGQVGAGTKLTYMRDLAGQDAIARGASVIGGIDIDRLEVAAMAARASTTFGPSKIVIEDHNLQVEVDFELRRDGGFSVQVGRSSYEDPDLSMQQPTTRIRLVKDVAFVIIPALTSAFFADSSWREHARRSFIEAAIDRLEGAVGALRSELGPI